MMCDELEEAKEGLRDLFRQYQDEGLPGRAVTSIRRRMEVQLGLDGKFKTAKIKTVEDVDLVKSVLKRRFLKSVRHQTMRP